MWFQGFRVPRLLFPVSSRQKALAELILLDFTTLKKRLTVADGALGLHLQKLQETGYITATKAFIGRRPNTSYRITPAGRKALTAYLAQMRTIIDAVEAAASDERLTARRRTESGPARGPALRPA